MYIYIYIHMYSYMCITYIYIYIYRSQQVGAVVLRPLRVGEQHFNRFAAVGCTIFGPRGAPCAQKGAGGPRRRGGATHAEVRGWCILSRAEAGGRFFCAVASVPHNILRTHLFVHTYTYMLGSGTQLGHTPR